MFSQSFIPNSFVPSYSDLEESKGSPDMQSPMKEPIPVKKRGMRKSPIKKQSNNDMDID
jgi:hypothetical protein